MRPKPSLDNIFPIAGSYSRTPSPFSFCLIFSDVVNVTPTPSLMNLQFHGCHAERYALSVLE
jgi:hypothetical protein